MVVVGLVLEVVLWPAALLLLLLGPVLVVQECRLGAGLAQCHNTSPEGSGWPTLHPGILAGRTPKSDEETDAGAVRFHSSSPANSPR